MSDRVAASAFKSKTRAAALAFFLGGLGAHRFYLHGVRDLPAWLHLSASALGVVGIERLMNSQLRSGGGWLCAALGYVALLAALLTAIVYGLRPDAKWDARFNATHARRSASGWTVILIVMAALFVGASVLMGGLAIGVQTYFEARLGAHGLN